ncbi:MAG: 6-hydroxymethylpterin diphosphokinase MptE-like protein [Treponemataceae bacterium]
MQIEMESLQDFEIFVSKIKTKKVYIFGAGNYGKIFAEYFNSIGLNFEGFIDNNSKLWGKQVLDKTVCNLDIITDKENIIVFISISSVAYIFAYKQVYDQLLSFGICDENIIEISKNIKLTQKIVEHLKNADFYINKLNDLKNKYLGKRAFLIGNGPSLDIKDLNKLNNDLSYGCNNLIEIMKKHNWKPSFFYFEDPVFIKNYLNTKEKIEYLSNSCVLIFSNIISNIFDEYKDCFSNLYFFTCNRYTLKKPSISENIVNGLNAGGTSLFSMLQILIYMGIKEIYLIGVDFSFNKELSSDGKLTVNEKIKNHAEGMNQANEGIYYVDHILEGWKAAKRYADTHGIKIYNATRGGKLEVFPRVDFDTLFNN